MQRAKEVESAELNKKFNSVMLATKAALWMKMPSHIHIYTHIYINIYIYIYVALCGTPGALGGPYHVNYIKLQPFWVFSRRHALDAPCLKHIISFVDVRSFNDAMTSYVTSRYCTCIGHVTIYYKRATNTSVKAVRFNSVT